LTGFAITPAHLAQVERWVDAGRRIHGDVIDWPQFGNWALYRAWATYRPGPDRTHWHLARALYHAQRDAVKWKWRHKNRQQPTPPDVVNSLIDGRFHYLGETCS
jgi:hypothetical protein